MLTRLRCGVFLWCAHCFSSAVDMGALSALFDVKLQPIKEDNRLIKQEQQLLTAEVRALGAQAQSPSRAQEGALAWEMCSDQHDGLPAHVVAAAGRDAAAHGATVPVDWDTRPIISESDLAAMGSRLPKASWELEFVVEVTAHLRAVTRCLAGHKELVLANSEVHAWIHTSGAHGNQQKPDLFLCHSSAYQRAEAPGQDSTNAQWLHAISRMDQIGAASFEFGRCAWPLRDAMVCFLEAKRQKLSLHEAIGECLSKARNLLFRSADERALGVTPRGSVKCILFDLEHVYLLRFNNAQTGGLESSRKFSWSAPGSFITLVNFLQAPAAQTPTWLRVLQFAQERFDCSIARYDSFLGHGSMGRVFRVSCRTGPQNEYALKVVAACASEDRIGLLETELRHLNELRAKAADPACVALLPSSPDQQIIMCLDASPIPAPVGAAVRFAPIGKSVAQCFPKKRNQTLWHAVSSALFLLHRNQCFHGDARMENLVLVPKLISTNGPAAATRVAAGAVAAEPVSWDPRQAQLVWIDFRESSRQPQRRAMDCLQCMRSFFRVAVSVVQELALQYEHIWDPPGDSDAASAASSAPSSAPAPSVVFAKWQATVWRTMSATCSAPAALSSAEDS